MAITTYSELQAAIADWMIRTDQTARIPQFIELAEQRFNKVIRRPEMEQLSVSSIEDGSITLPDDFLQARSVYLDGTPRIVLQQMSAPHFNDYNHEGTPAYYSLAGNLISVGPFPSEEHDVILSYYAKIPALSDANPTNWLLNAHSDIYLAASLAEGFAYTLDAERGTYWEARAVQKLDDLRREGIERAYGSAPLRMRGPSVFARLSIY